MNPLHKPESNGCGSFGYRVCTWSPSGIFFFCRNTYTFYYQWNEEKLPLKELEECCHTHDFCYDDCGADKDLCDLHFKKCLYKVCSSREEDLSMLFMKGK